MKRVKFYKTIHSCGKIVVREFTWQIGSNVPAKFRLRIKFWKYMLVIDKERLD